MFEIRSLILKPEYNTLIKQTFPIIVVISILTGVYFLNNQNESKLFDNHCYLESQTCKLRLLDSQVIVHFDRYPIIIEELLALSIVHDNYFVLQNGWVEGTNMFMGKTNLFIGASPRNEKEVTHEAELFIGSCSEPRMRWKLVLNLTDVRTGEDHQVSIFFQTNYS